MRAFAPTHRLLVCLVTSACAACADPGGTLDLRADASASADAGNDPPDAGAPPTDAAADAGPAEDARAVDAAAPDAEAPDSGAARVTWEEAELPGELLRWGATVAPRGDGQHYLFGGFELVRRALVTTNDLLLVDMRGDAPVITEVTTTSTPPARSRACAAYDPVSQRLVMRGGRASGRALNDGTTWELDVQTQRWSVRETAEAPPGLVGCAMTYVASDRAMYHFGGAFEAPDFDWSSELWRFDLETHTWSRVAVEGTAPPRGYDMTMAAHDGTIVLFGGGIGVSGNGEFRSDLYTFDVATRRWTRLSTGRARPEGRRGPWMLVSTDGQRVLIGGGESVEEPLDDVWLYDRARSVWEDLTPEGTRPLAQGPFATALPGPGDATISIYGGLGDLTGTPTDAAWRLRLEGFAF